MKRSVKFATTACCAVLLGLSPLPATWAWAAEAPRDPVHRLSAVTTPAKPPQERIEGFVPSPELRSVRFDFDRSEIRPQAARVLDKNAEWMKSDQTYTILIEGAADARGSRAYNQALGERRAQVVKAYLVARGVAPDRIMVVSYGKERPACRTPGEACWSQNRRADFQVRHMTKQAP
jgi:peptidoglycan-associated lipoprotein